MHFRADRLGSKNDVARVGMWCRVQLEITAMQTWQAITLNSTVFSA